MQPGSPTPIGCANGNRCNDGPLQEFMHYLLLDWMVGGGVLGWLAGSFVKTSSTQGNVRLAFTSRYIERWHDKTFTATEFSWTVPVCSIVLPATLAEVTCANPLTLFMYLFIYCIHGFQGAVVSLIINTAHTNVIVLKCRRLISKCPDPIITSSFLLKLINSAYALLINSH